MDDFYGIGSVGFGFAPIAQHNFIIDFQMPLSLIFYGDGDKFLSVGTKIVVSSRIKGDLWGGGFLGASFEGASEDTQGKFSGGLFLEYHF